MRDLSSLECAVGSAQAQNKHSILFLWSYMQYNEKRTEPINYKNVSNNQVIARKPGGFFNLNSSKRRKVMEDPFILFTTSFCLSIPPGGIRIHLTFSFPGSGWQCFSSTGDGRTMISAHSSPGHFLLHHEFSQQWAHQFFSNFKIWELIRRRKKRREYLGVKLSNACSGKAELELLKFIFKLNVLVLHVNGEQLSPSERPCL